MDIICISYLDDYTSHVKYINKIGAFKFEVQPTIYTYFQKHIIWEGQTNTNYYIDATILNDEVVAIIS